MDVRLDRIASAIDSLERAANHLSNYAKGWRDYDRIKEMHATAAEANQEYQKLVQAWPRAKSLVDEAARSYDRYVTREPEGCTCHISPPCSYCTSQTDEDPAT